MPEDRRFNYRPKQPPIIVEFRFNQPVTGSCRYTLRSESNPQGETAVTVSGKQEFSFAVCPPSRPEQTRLVVTLQLAGADSDGTVTARQGDASQQWPCPRGGTFSIWLDPA